MAGVCCYRPDASDARLAFHLREGAYDTDQLIPIVQALGRLLGGDAPVILIWDNLPAHHSIAMGAWLAVKSRSWSLRALKAASFSRLKPRCWSKASSQELSASASAKRPRSPATR